jgi:hypothetical protein
MQAIVQAFPGVRSHVEGGNLKYIYGAPMTGGVTPDAAAAAWIDAYASAWGVDAEDLELDRVVDIVDGQFTVFAYKQTLGGLPVEYGIARVVVNNTLNRVVLASSKLAEVPQGGFAAVALESETAVGLVSNHPTFRAFKNWTIPELVVWSDDTGRRTTEAWKFEGGLDEPGNFQWRTFFVDVATGAILEARDEVHTIDVSGTVLGNGTPNLRAHYAANPPAPLAMPKVRMSISGGNNAFTTTNGTYTIPHGGSTAVTVSSNLSSGQWVNVNPNGVAELSVSGSVVPPGPGNFTFGAGSVAEGNVAQVNAFIHTTLTHDYIKDRAPSFTGLDIVIPANTGVSGSCNAFFTTGGGGPSINFYNAGGGCNNTSFSTVVAHEYGHFIVNRLGLSQGAFGEGYGDVMAIMIYDTGIVGEFFQTTGGAVRNPASANQQYPCSSSAIHTCGQILGGTWYELNQLYKGFYGTTDGLDRSRDLNVGWSMITLGGSGLNSAHPGTAIEMLTIDDNNGNLADGTPNYNRICNALGQHGISCPDIELLAFEYPDGLPTFVAPGVPANFRVNVLAAGDTPVAGTGRMFFSVNGGSTSFVNLAEDAPNQYTATLPVLNCGDSVQYYFSATAASNGNQLDPLNAPGTRYSTVAGTSEAIAFDDTMETNKGWTAGTAGDTATSGIWVRADPVGTAAQPEDDHTPAPGTICWVTGNATPGAGVGTNDIDGGVTTLVSPVFDLSGKSAATISYWRWFSNNQGASPNEDVMTVQISNNGGSTWTNVEVVGPTGPQAGGGWYFHEFSVTNFVSLTSNMRMRFRPADAGSGSIVEAALDDFQIRTIECEQPPPCDLDVNGDTTVDVLDFLDFLDAYSTCDGQAAGCTGASGVDPNWNGDGVVDVLDLLDYLDAYSNGCP